MTDQDIKSRIKQVAVDHFDQYGYFGATIRNIAADAKCSLPMVYYYYKSKQELFHEIIKTDYFALIARRAQESWSEDIVTLYTKYVCGLNNLSDYDRKVYRLGIKVYLSFDGDEELQAVMDDWEKTIHPRHEKLLLPHLQGMPNGTAVIRTLMHLLENLVESIVVKQRTLSEAEVQEEISTVLCGISKKQTHLSDRSD